MEKALFNGVLIEEYIDVHNFSEDIVAVELKIDLPIEKVTVLKHGTYFYSHSNDTLYKGNFTLDENEENQSFLELEPLVFNGIKTSMAILLHNLYDYLPYSNIKYEFGKFLGIEQKEKRPELSYLKEDKIKDFPLWNSPIVHDIAKKNVESQSRSENEIVDLFSNTQKLDGYKINNNIELIYNICDKDVVFSDRIEMFDLILMSVIDNLFYYNELEGNTELRLSARQIAFHLCGGESGSRPSNLLIEEVKKSLQKIDNVKFLLNTTKEFIANNKMQNNDDIIDVHRIKLFNYEINYHYSKGNITTTYVFTDHSGLYKHQKKLNQIIFLPSSYFKTKCMVTNTKKSITFKFYLMRRISQMKYDKEHNRHNKYSNRIKLESMYKYCSIQTPSEKIEKEIQKRIENGEDPKDKNKLAQIRKAAQADRKYIEGILDYLIAMCWITSYSVVKENREIVGYDIDFNQKNLI